MNDEKKNVQMTPVICTQCGASLGVDPKQEAAVCEYCGTPFIPTLSHSVNLPIQVMNEG